ncbi:hypothetical protein BAUCODRAFT_80591 [Baudoinia panamericana UAMH 10762]|uniref:EXS domain-containing protein n=1 Tax=Baudoinia panamericana (strain UAMH 10762) TaxID=717646 RepID=M2LBB8_BAUPA|nr:uncharacterized protein BAUCODRAFT_80591 [Baudoinia panamericana UAMH 10762]EMC91122.1 hypothetical protein BAUCODRAFT_80591 [Baudoinia panamericana UAMH 10762]
MAELDVPLDELDTFSLLLPLPYRLASTLVLGVWLWGVNLQVLQRHGIDTPALIRYSARTDPPPHLSVYRFATVLTTPLAASLIYFWWWTAGGQQERVIAHSLVPNVTLILVLALAFLIPQRWLYPREFWPATGRLRLLHTFRRILVGGIARPEEGKFGDVLLADALTSYSRPLSELYIVFYMMAHQQATTNRIDRSSAIAVPIIMSIPFVIRFKQCITDWQPYNALKYATAFPAIAVSTFMRLEEPYINHGNLHAIWMLTALTNALYSYYWDVTRDWDLTLLTPKRASPDHPYGLRRTRIFSDTRLYYAMIFIDLLLRFAWALKLSPHLEHYYDIELGIFLLELLEVVRRFLWIFFRIETEWVRSRQPSGMVVLSELGPKIDED